MKASAAWEMSIAELERKEHELYDQIFKLRFQLSTGQMDNPLRMRVAKKDLARVKTVLNAKRKAAAEVPKAPGATNAKETDQGTGKDQSAVPAGEGSS